MDFQPLPTVVVYSFRKLYKIGLGLRWVAREQRRLFLRDRHLLFLRTHLRLMESEEGGLKTLYVGNLPWSTTEDDLAEIFSAAAEVKGSRIITDRESGRSRGFGFVEVDDNMADQVIETMNGKVIGGREIIVNEAKPRQQM